MLTKEEIDIVIDILKNIEYDKEIFSFPCIGESTVLNATSNDKKYKFIFDIKPGRSKRVKDKLTLQERYGKDVVLVRLDINGPPHTNPDGETVSGNHIHIIKDGYDDKFAYDIPTDLVDADDNIQTMINFFQYCKVFNPEFAAFERRLTDG